MKDFFGRLFGKEQKAPPDQEGGNAVCRIEPQQEGVALYKKGDLIGGQYEVHGTLGEGGFGVVYLVQVRDTRDKLALKTFRDDGRQLKFPAGDN